MENLGRELAVFECISFSDALQNATTVLEERAAAEEGDDREWLEAIRRHVIALLADEHKRLAAEYHRLSVD